MAVRVNRAGSDQPLIPDIAGITALVDSELRASKLKVPFERLLNHFTIDGRSSPNIEDLLSHIRSLNAVAGKDSVRGLSHTELSDLDAAICDIVVRVASCRLPGPSTPYHRLAAWIGGAERLSPIELFTTNYDLLLEEALEANRVPFFDGFVGSFETFFDLQAMEGDLLPARWARLWKIHGSLNWYEDSNGNIHRGSVAGARHVIYPSHLKYDESRRMPYLAMLDRLRAFVRQSAAVLIICGYSFNDMHLNEVIAQGLQGNATSVAFAFMWGRLSAYTRAMALAKNRANLNVLADDEGIIGTKQARWTRGKLAANCADSIAVSWVPDPVDANKKDAHFKLGDFGALSKFTEELIGERQRSEDILNAK